MTTATPSHRLQQAGAEVRRQFQLAQEAGRLLMFRDRSRKDATVAAMHHWIVPFSACLGPSIGAWNSEQQSEVTRCGADTRRGAIVGVFVGVLADTSIVE